MKRGIFILVIGVIALIFVYSMRPPSGLGEALMMASQDRSYLKEPIYLLLMAVFGSLSAIGLGLIIKNLK